QARERRCDRRAHDRADGHRAGRRRAGFARRARARGLPSRRGAPAGRRMLRRAASRAGRLDRPAVVLASLAPLEAVVWMVLLPPWLGPDEAPHFAYTQRMVENHSIPWFRHGDPQDRSRPSSYSTELSTALAWGGSLSLRLNLQDRPPGSPVSEALWRRADAPLSDAD